MKDSLGPLVVIALLIGGAWFGVTRYMNGVSAHANIPSTTEAAAKKELKEKRVHKAGAKRQSNKSQANAPDSVTTEQALDVPPREPITVVVPVRREFPNPADLPPGTRRLQIQDRFGKPDIQATTVDRGALLETYLYRNRPDGRTVIVYLKDGRVQRAQAFP